MRLLHIDTGQEMRGGQGQVLLLLEVLREAGHECILLTRRNSPLQKEAARLNITWHDASIPNIWSLSRGVDLVHVHDAHAHTLSAIAAQAPFVVSRRVAFPVRASMASRWKYSRAVRFLAVSRFVADQLYAAGIPREKVDVVYDAVRQPRYLNEWSADAPAVALDSDDPLKCRDVIKSACLEATLDCTFSNDLERDFQHASMFLYISRSEGLGSAVLLAMSMGVPVITNRVGGLNEVIEQEVSGIFTDGSAEGVAGAMMTIAGNPQLAHRLISGGRQRVAERFTTRHLLAGTLCSYTRALGH